MDKIDHQTAVLNWEMSNLRTNEGSRSTRLEVCLSLHRGFCNEASRILSIRGVATRPVDAAISMAAYAGLNKTSLGGV
jgi:hypothetical protein